MVLVFQGSHYVVLYTHMAVIDAKAVFPHLPFQSCYCNVLSEAI